MWYLISENNPDIKYCILGGKVYVVGRRDCDILVTGDASVSRKHSELSMSHSEANLTNTSRLPILRLKDLSKFGTWVNKQKVEGERLLKDGDIVHFGSPASSFMIVYEPLVLTTSCLDTPGKKLVRQTLCTLGGHMINEWKQDCSLLIMNKISVTIKVICALVTLKPIVTPAYLEAFLKLQQGTGEKPDPDIFIPDLAETQLDPSEVSFTANNGRRTVFQRKTFIFFSDKQLKKMCLAIELAGGMPMLMAGKMDSELLLGPDTIVMSCSDSDITKDNQALVTKATALLQKNDKHLIPDAEIGYAVLYCSTEKHCNPDHKPDRELSRLPSQTLSQMEPFPVNTQSQSCGDSMKIQRESYPCKSAATKTSLNRKRLTSNKAVNETGAPTSEVALSGYSDSLSNRDIQPIEVKEEPLSGRSLSQRKGQKRHRDLDEEEETNGTPIKMKRIKEEPVTHETKLSKQPEKQPAASGKHVPETVVWDSDDEGVDYTTIDTDLLSARKTGSSDTLSESTSRSVSPSRQKTRGQVSETRQQNSSLPSRSLDDLKPETSLTRSRSPSPVKNQQKTLKECMFPRQSNSRSQNRIKEEQDVVSENIRNQGSKCSGSTLSGNMDDKTNNKTHQDADESNGMLISQQRNIVINDDECEREELDVKSEVLSGDVPSGFLTTRKPIERQVKCTRNYEEDTELPRGCVTVEFTSLLARKPQAITNKEQTRCPEGFTRWRGKIVKNFKRFKKSHNSGSQGLPNIIGGSDLEVNQGHKSKEMDDWFKEALQAESQHTSNERRDQDLFDYNPAMAKRRGR